MPLVQLKISQNCYKRKLTFLNFKENFISNYFNLLARISNFMLLYRQLFLLLLVYFCAPTFSGASFFSVDLKLVKGYVFAKKTFNVNGTFLKGKSESLQWLYGRVARSNEFAWLYNFQISLYQISSCMRREKTTIQKAIECVNHSY